MSSKTIKKLLLSLIVVGILGSFTAGGTYALLNAEGTNPNDSIASGTLTMDNTVGASTCHSTSASVTTTPPGTTAPGNSNLTWSSTVAGVTTASTTTCATLLTSGLLYPISNAAEPPLPSSSTYVSANVTITNTGSLPATLKIYMPSCTYATNGSYTATTYTAVNPCCPGTTSGALPASACSTGSLDFFIQEYNAGFTTANASCIWPINAGAACTFQNDSLGTFWAQYDVTSASPSPLVPKYLSLGSLAAGASRYFQIALAEPSTGTNINGLQGQTATLALIWHEE